MNIGKIILSFLVVFVLLIVISFSMILASTTPWSQTDWSGGNGQTSWFDNTKYSATSNVNSSATGVTTLDKQTEKFTNTGFEVDLSSWDEVATYSGEILNTETANLAGYYQLNESNGSTVTDSSSQSNDGSYTGVTLDNSTGPDNQPVGYWDGTNGYADIYSSALNTDFDGTEGSLSLWFKTADQAMWTDGNYYYLT